ncbi:MAG TPA: GAF domain-containing SpoIIE family protein phosphatase [Thermoleophilaceae bacterium]|nr:GAF domain-containing SpoIIE family protein phosphatase [Thermoleophilaceae bacterium]
MTRASTLPTSTPAPTPPAPWRERTLSRLVRHVRAVLPVSAVAFVTADSGEASAERAAGWFASEDLREAMEASMSRLVRTGALLLPRVDAWQAAPELMSAIAASLGEERAREAWESFRSASLIVCPVRDEIGRPLGALVVASLDEGRPLRTAQLPTMQAMADLAAMALERTSLLEAEGRRARDELRLKRASEAMSGSLDPDEVYVRVVEHAAGVTGATRALLTRLNARSGELRTAAQVDFSDELAQSLLALDSGSFGHVARNRAPVLRRDEDAAPLGCLMHAPIELGPRLYGVLTVGHEDPERFGPDDLELLVKLARSSAAAIANAIDYQRERRIARALTLGFVPESLPELPGYETGLLYAPAANEPTGGDVYGAWPVGDGEAMAVLVGDVAGKGVETAALSAMVRFFVEARSWDTLSPAKVLEQANAMLLSRLPRDTFVTAFLGILSRDSLRYCNAAHLPPLHVRGGSIRPLDSHGLPLGVLERHGYSESELRLEGDDLVFAHTDGLIEARRAGEMYGGDRLARLVSGWSATHPPQELVRAVHEEVMSWADGISDDAVALALKRSA